MPSILRRLFRQSNIPAIITIITAGVALILTTLGVIKTTPLEGIIVGLLCLLAIDTLWERVGLLERMESQLNKLAFTSTLKSRSEYQPFNKRGETSSEIAVLGVSLTTVVPPNIGFFSEKLKNGCKLRIVLMNPKSQFMKLWSTTSPVNNTENEINSCLETMKLLINEAKHLNRSCEVRLTENFAPFSLAAFDPKKEKGVIYVEYHVYKRYFEDRPHVTLTKHNDSHWFNIYLQQFEQIWSEATPWNPDN